jgi:hypothetical protein
VNYPRAIAIPVILGLVPLTVGCNKGTNVQRLPVHGTVTVAGGEKPSGFITFLPAEGRPGPSAITPLADGSYQFDRTNGPTIGPQTVIVKRRVTRDSILRAIAERKRPPPRKNSEWTCSASVSDDGTYLQDFDLKD